MKIVQVVDSETGEIIKENGPLPESKAERLEDGINVNLDHERFHTRIIDER